MDDQKAKAVFSANVKRLLHARGKNTHWLMLETKELPNRIYPAVKGAALPTLGLVSRIAKALGVKVDELLDEKRAKEFSKILEKSA